MIKHLQKLFIALFVVAASAGAHAQNLNESLIKSMVPYKPSKKLQASASRNTSCGVDTIVYPYYKELIFTATNDSFFTDAMVGAVRTASQAYLNTDTISVKGIQFWGAAYSTGTSPQTLLTKAYLYNIDGTNKPTTIIDSALVTITNNYDFYEAMFAVPVTVTGNFAVAVKSAVNDTLAVVTNNAGNVWTTPDYSESLAWRRFGSGTWNSTLSFFGQDLEYMIFPIVEYDVDVNMSTTSNDTICEGDSVAFTNTFSPVYQNRMFNLYEFDAFWNGEVDSTFLWIYGNGDFDHTTNGGTTYNTPGTYTPKLYGYQLGYYTFCVDSAWMTIEVMPDVMAAFNVDNSAEPTFTFTSTSTGAATYSWDFGDSTTSTAPNPTHTYTANGTYTVTLVTNGFCGGDTTTQVVNVISIDTRANKEDYIRSYYSSSERALVIDLGKSSATLQVFDMIGNSVISTALMSKNNRLSVSSLPEGTYIMKVTSGGVIKTTRFVLVK